MTEITSENLAQKHLMDDFASLFLPDLLHPLDPLPGEDRTKPEVGSRGPILQNQNQNQHPSHSSVPPSTFSLSMSLARFFEASQPAARIDADSNPVIPAYTDSNQYLQQYQPQKPANLATSTSTGLFVSPYTTHMLRSGAQSGAVNFEVDGGAANEPFMGTPDATGPSGPSGLTGSTGPNGPYGPYGLYGPNRPPSRNHGFPSNFHCLLPILNLDMGHTLHYAEFLPPEASFQQSQRQIPYHLGLFPQGLPGSQPQQYDESGWAGTSDPAAAASAVINKGWFGMAVGMPPTGYISGATDINGLEFNAYATPEHRAKRGSEPKDSVGADSLPEQDQNVALVSTDQAVELEKTEEVSEASVTRNVPKLERRNRTKPPQSCSLAPSITVNYSKGSLGQLVDFKRTDTTSESRVTCLNGEAIKFSLSGFLNGRLMTNDQDNYNYIYLSTGAVDTSLEYNPQVISCYRRNFINIHLNLRIDRPTSEMMIAGEVIKRLRVEVSATTNKRDTKPVTILDNGNEQEQKELRKAGDNFHVEVISPCHVIEMRDCKPDSYWKVKRLQFKSATANSTNLSFQTYYRFLVRVIAETSAGDHIVEEVTSNPIIVRGRNPSFYQAKSDVMIKAKSPSETSSYHYSLLATPLSIGSLSRLEIKIEDSDVALASDDPGSLLNDKSTTEEDTARGQELTNEKSSSEKDNHATGNDSQSNQEDDEEETSAGDPTKPKEDPVIGQLPSGVDIRRIIDAMSQTKGEKYHYFPILKVYYLPPINVVYFPHGAHHTGNDTDGKSNSTSANPHAKGSDEHRKHLSRVYFR